MGSVLCNTPATMKNGASISYDPTVGSKVLGVAPPVTTALVDGTPLPAAPWYMTSPVTISLTSVANDWATVAGITYTIDEGIPGVITGPSGSFTVPAAPYPVPPDGTYTVQYSARDNIGSQEAAQTVVIRIDTTTPAVTSFAIAGGAAWTGTAAVTLDLDVADAGAGGVEMRFRDEGEDWGAWRTYAASAPWTLPTGDGSKTVYAQFKDALGNTTTEVSDSIGLDTTTPAVTSFAIAGGAAWTGTADVTLDLDVADAGAGGIEMRFRDEGEDWGAWRTYAASAPWTLPTGDGPKTVYAQFKDALGNTTTEVSDSIGLDTTTPAVTSFAIAGGAAWTGTAAVTLDLDVADAGAGGIEMRFRDEGEDWGAWRTYAASAPWTLPTGDGPKTVYAQFKDALGNTTTEVSDSIGLDTTTPAVTSFAIAGGAAWTGTAAVTLDLDVADAGAGGIEMRFRDEGEDWGAWRTYAASAPWTLPTGDGPKTVYAQFKDALGNTTTEVSDSIGLDTTAPDSTIDLGPDGWTMDDTPSFTWSGSDNLTPAPDLVFSDEVDTDSWSDFGSATSVTLDALEDGAHTIYVKARDLAGNESEVASWAFGVDVTAPSVTLIPRNGASTLYNQPVFDFSATDSGGSDLAADQPAVKLVALDADSQPVGEPQTIAAVPGKPLPAPLENGDYRLSVVAKDRAGNSDTESFDFHVAAPPITVKSDTIDAGQIFGVYADASWSPNGDWDSTSWEWTISQNGLEDPNWVTFREPMAFVTPAVSGDYRAQLVVTDDVGAQATGAQCVVDKQLSVGALKPRVHALNVQVVDGQPAELVGRFVDPAWGQTHSATWDVEGIPAPVAELSEDDLAAMESGIVEGVTPPLHADQLGRNVLAGHLTVSADNGGPSTTVPFTITIRADSSSVDEEPNGTDGNNKITGSNPQIGDDGKLVQSYIQSANDVDIFEVTKANGEPLEVGTQVLVTLRNLPADYDVAVIGDFTYQPEFVIPKADLAGTSFPTAGTVNAGRVQFEGARLISGGKGRLISGGKGRLISGGKGRLIGGGKGYLICGGFGRLVGGGKGRFVSGGRGAIDETLYETWTSNMSLSQGEAAADTIGIGAGRLVGGGKGRLVGGGKGRLIGGGKGADDPEDYYRDPDGSATYSYFATDLGGDQTKLLEGYPFSDMSYTLLDDNTTSGGDVTFEELGFSHEEMLNRYIAGYSAASGTRTEVVLTTVELKNGRTYIAVKGANGACSADVPYTVQVETTPDLNYTKLWNAGQTRPKKVTTGVTTEASVSYTGRRDRSDPETEVADPQTLFVTQPQRIDAIYRTDAEETPYADIVETALKDACDSEHTGYGAILTVPSSVYDDWDVTPWDTDLANGVTDNVRDAINDYVYGDGSNSNDTGHPSIKYVVLVGSDDVVPQRRVPDQTVFANEGLYAAESALNIDSTLESGLYDSQILSDDFYVDKTPIPYNSRYLYVPDLAVARLVETPTEIAGTIQKFLAEDGLLKGGSSVVTGQEFMNDGAQRVADILTAADLDTKLESLDTWSLQNLQDDLPSRNVVNLNAHFVHYGGISAAGYQQMQEGEDWSAEFLSGNQIADSPNLSGKLTFSLGCHAGLSVPDDQASAMWGDLDTSLDVAQAMALQKGVLVASTGYGLGDWYGIAGTEEMMGRFADQVTTAGDTTLGQPIGVALTLAKRQYFLAMSAVTVYDEKSSIQLTMYGMPQYRLPCTTHTPPAAGDVVNADPIPPAPQTSFDEALPPTPVEVTISDQGETRTYDDATLIEPNTDTETARYLTVDGDSQATMDRPTQPRMVIDLGPAGDTPVTGVIVTGGTYTDYPDFDPAISSATSGWYTDSTESMSHADGWSPASPATVTTVSTPDGRRQQLVLVLGQFYATDVGEGGITGIERLWPELNVKLVRADLSGVPAGTEPDLIGPTVGSVTLSHVGSEWTATVAATDESDISRIDVTQIGDGSAQHFSQSISPTDSSPYEVHFSLPGVAPEDVSLMIEVYDGCNNVTTQTAKGFLITGPPSGTMTLNHGAEITYSRLVELDSSKVVNARDMRASFDNGSTWTDWMPFYRTSLVTLPPEPGQTHFVVQYRNADPSVLGLSATITLKPPPISAGEDNSFAVSSDNSLRVWGYNSVGQLGDGTVSDSSAPHGITTGSDPVPWTSVSARGTHTVALDATGTMWAWGANDRGQVGDTTTTDRHAPVEIGTGQTWSAVAAGGLNTFAIRSDGTMWAWGYNNNGQLGDGTTTDQHSPVQVRADHDWIAVAAGGNFQLALKEDGSLWAWGNNLVGQLGVTGTATRTAPVQVGSDNDWVAIAAGGNHSLAVKADGSLWAWGNDFNGQIGNGDQTGNCFAPVQIGADGVWTAVAGGQTYSLALKADGSLWAWGENFYRQFGTPSPSYSPAPVQVGSSHWVAIAADDHHSMGLKNDGSLWTWGDNNHGQLGDMTTGGPKDPVQVIDRLADVQPPSTDVVPPGFDGNSHSTDVQIELTASDDVAVDHIEYRVDDAIWESVAGSSAMIIVPAPAGGGNDGVHTVRYRAVDSAGNVEPAQSGNVRIDTTGPIMAILWPLDGSTINADSAIVSFFSGDAVTTTLATTLDSSPVFTDGASPDGQTLSSLSSGPHTLTVTGTDAAGNPASVSSDFTVDLGPQGTMTLNGGDPDTYASTVTLHSDVTGATQMRTSTDNVNWTEWRPYLAGSLVALPGLPGDHTVWVQYGDGSPNVLTRSATVTRERGSESAGSHSLIVKNDGSLWAWGWNLFGQVGNGSTDGYGLSTPVRIGSETDWAVIAAGFYHSLALKGDGSLYSWGYNEKGQVGDGGTTDQTSPVPVAPGDHWSQIGGGGAHSLALGTDGSLWAWGWNEYGQLGDGSGVDQPNPVQVGSDKTWVAIAAGYKHNLALKTDGSLWAWGDNYGEL